MSQQNRPQIVVLDGHTLVPHAGPGEPDWSALEALGNVRFYDRSPADTVIERSRNASIILTNKTPLPADVIKELNTLKYIGVSATGYNVVDVDAATKRNVVVSNVPDYGAFSVAQHTFALLLELTNAVGKHDQMVHQGAWSKCADFCFTAQPLTELADQALGIVGLGAIGRQVARIGHALGMRIMAAHQRSMDRVDLGFPIKWLPVASLFAAADVITLHCPLTEQTRQLVNDQTLATMKRTSYLINTGRGGLVDENALDRALRTGVIAGAGLDVLSVEPPPEDHPLLSAPNCIVTPHIGWATQAARRRCMSVVVQNIQAFLRGEPRNAVNPGKSATDRSC